MILLLRDLFFSLLFLSSLRRYDEVTKRAAEEAAKHAGGLERDLGASRAEAKALREEVAASDGTKHEVKALQRRLLAAQVDARLGWQEVHKLHLARMERMEAAVGGFNRREETLSRELSECRAQLEIETREHARLRETHREVTAEAAEAAATGVNTHLASMVSTAATGSDATGGAGADGVDDVVLMARRRLESAKSPTGRAGELSGQSGGASGGGRTGSNLGGESEPGVTYQDTEALLKVSLETPLRLHVWGRPFPLFNITREKGV